VGLQIAGRRGLAGPWHDTSNDGSAPIFVWDSYGDRLFDSGMSRQARFDLAELDPIPSALDLVITAP
jgi:hypothetical protein